MSPDPVTTTSSHSWQNAFAFAPGVTISSDSAFIFLSGQTGRDLNGEFTVGVDVGKQARAAFTHIASLLERSGSSLDRIVKLTYYVTDMESWPAVAQVRAEFFQGYKPPSTVMEVNRLFDPSCLIEIDVIAIKA
jgi:2-iminobutanoate/2-iminopropanoate deaminase